MTCKNEIQQNVPTKYDYKIVKGRCGQTGIHGQPVFCQSCIDAGAMKRHEQREHDLKYNNY